MVFCVEADLTSIEKIFFTLITFILNKTESKCKSNRQSSKNWLVFEHFLLGKPGVDWGFVFGGFFCGGRSEK